MHIGKKALAAAFLLAGTALSQAKTERPINVVVNPEPTSLMLGLVQSGPTQLVAGNIYEGLLRYGPDLQPQPQLPKSWDISADKLVYTFKLHDNVLWHDGKRMTASDVVFSANVFLRETHPRLRTILEHVASISAPDDRTVVFTLKAPFEPFIKAFQVGTMPIVPKHIYEGTDFRKNPANAKPIGTGPYRLAQWSAGTVIKLERFDRYYEAGKPAVPELYYHIIPDATARSIAFETGVVDVLPGGSVEPYDIPRLKSVKNSCISDKGWEMFAPMSWLWLNNRQGPTSDKRFRQAVMYALDRKFHLNAIWMGAGKVATSPFGSTLPYHRDVLPYSHDLNKAKSLLKEMGYVGEPVRLLPLPYGETWKRWGEAVRQNLEAAGIKVKVVATDNAGWSERISNWDFDIAFTYQYQHGDPAIGIDRLYLESNIAKGSPWNNAAGYVNAAVDKGFKEAALAASSEQRDQLYKRVQETLADEVPLAWLIELGFPTVYNCDLQGLFETAIGLNDAFKNARWKQ